MSVQQRKALLEQLAVIAFDPVHDEDISEMLEGADIKNQEDLNVVQPQTPWGNKSKKVKERSKEWITRFVDREARIKVRPDRDNLMTSWKRRANTKTFGPFHDLPTIPVRQGAKTREAKRALDAVAKLDKPPQLLMCDECWGTVTPGSGLVCQGCEQVCMHLHCLPKDCRSSAQLDGWACELCMKGDVASGYAEDFIIAKRTKLHNHMWAVHKLQSFARMVPYRYQFTTLRRGVRAIQRSYRGIVFWRTQFKAKVKELRPIRIRLHNLFVYVARPEVDEHHVFQAVPPSFHAKTGHFPTSLYEQHVAPVSKEAKIANKRASIAVGGDADADGRTGHTGHRGYAGHTGASAGGANDDEHGSTAAHDQMSDAVRAQVELLKLGYKEYPHYFGGLGHAYQPVKLAAKDALFLTVTLIEYDWETAMEKQIYRVDMPLTCAQPHNMYASCVKDIYGPNYEHHMPQPSEEDKNGKGKDSSGRSTPRRGKKNSKQDDVLSFCSDFNEELHVLKTNFGKTCSSILIPGAPACVDLVMTLSKVSQWPKAFVVGQQRERITQNLIWRNLTTYNQAMQPGSELRGNNLPSSDEQSKLLLYLPKVRRTCCACLACLTPWFVVVFYFLLF